MTPPIIKTSVSTIYHAEVEVPYDIYEHYCNTAGFDEQSLSAAALVAESGESMYDGVVWGDAPTKKQCRDFVKSWVLYLSAIQENTTNTGGGGGIELD